MSTQLDALAARIGAAADGGRFPSFDPRSGETVLEPDGPGRGHWVGAPSVVYEPQSELVWMSYRRRRPRDGSPDERGYMAVVAHSSDAGRTFTTAWQVTKHQIGTSSLERFCLRRAPEGGWLLYTSWEDPPSSGQWRIDVLRAPHPGRWDLAAAHPVLTPAATGADAVKDPYVIGHGERMVMFVSTFLTPRGPAPTWRADSRDGVAFTWRGEALGVGRSWDAYQARLACVVAVDGGFVGYYDGADSPGADTEERSGLACSQDLRTWRRVSETAPALVSAHASGSLRYVDVVSIAGQWWAYYEYARADGSHELRRSRLSR